LLLRHLFIRHGAIQPQYKSHKKPSFLTSVVHITVTAAIDTWSCEKFLIQEKTSEVKHPWAVDGWAVIVLCAADR